MKATQPVVIVASVHRAIDWYTRLFDFQVTFRNEIAGQPDTLNYAVLEIGGAEIHLGLARDMENPAGAGAFNLLTDEFETVYERAQSGGVVFFIQMSTIPTGQRTFGIRDPDGNLVTLVEDGVAKG